MLAMALMVARGGWRWQKPRWFSAGGDAGKDRGGLAPVVTLSAGRCPLRAPPPSPRPAAADAWLLARQAGQSMRSGCARCYRPRSCSAGCVRRLCICDADGVDALGHLRMWVRGAIRGRGCPGGCSARAIAAVVVPPTRAVDWFALGLRSRSSTRRSWRRWGRTQRAPARGERHRRRPTTTGFKSVTTETTRSCKLSRTIAGRRTPNCSRPLPPRAA